MKNYLVFCLFFMLAMTPPLAGAIEPTDTEFSESILAPAKVDQGEQLIIKLNEDKVFTFDTVPDREKMKEALGLKVPDKLKQQILARNGTIEEADPLQAFASMSDENQKKFMDMRVKFLTNAARVLNSTKFAFGAGSLVGDTFSFIKIKTLQAVGKTTANSTGFQRSFQQRSQETIASMLTGIDYKLFSQAPLVIESNEVGISLSAGILAESGVLRRGGGGSEELGFSLAFNKTSKAFVFELFHNSEKFDNTKAAVTVLGVVGKAGMTMGRREGPETLKGSSFYPPVVPAFSSTSSDYFFAGLSSSVGLPPPPLADFLTFTNKFERHVWIRITVSPVLKGFVRLQIGDVQGSFKLIGLKFIDAFTAITDKVRMARARSCLPLFV